MITTVYMVHQWRIQEGLWGCTELRKVATACFFINIEFFWNVTQLCSAEGQWGPVEYVGCQRTIFVSIQATNTMSKTGVLTAMENIGAKYGYLGG